MCGLSPGANIDPAKEFCKATAGARKGAGGELAARPPEKRDASTKRQVQRIWTCDRSGRLNTPNLRSWDELWHWQMLISEHGRLFKCVRILDDLRLAETFADETQPKRYTWRGGVECTKRGSDDFGRGVEVAERHRDDGISFVDGGTNAVRAWHDKGIEIVVVEGALDGGVGAEVRIVSDCLQVFWGVDC